MKIHHLKKAMLIDHNQSTPGEFNHMVFEFIIGVSWVIREGGKRAFRCLVSDYVKPTLIEFKTKGRVHFNYIIRVYDKKSRA